MEIEIQTAVFLRQQQLPLFNQLSRLLSADFPGINLIRRSTAADSEQALLKGEIDCIVYREQDMPVYPIVGTDYFCIQPDGFYTKARNGAVPPPESPLSIVFRKNDPVFRIIRSAYIYPCIIAGAGSGRRADNTTIAVINEIKEAEFILHDVLINREVLSYASSDCQLIDVGKRPGGKGATQEDICEKLTGLTRQGFRVLRLKGGSPAYFARLDEEVDALHKLDIPYVVYPGVDSASAFVSLYSGSLTRRGDAPGVEVVNLRPLRGEVNSKTKVYYMGVGAFKSNRLPKASN